MSILFHALYHAHDSFTQLSSCFNSLRSPRRFDEHGRTCKFYFADGVSNRKGCATTNGLMIMADNVPRAVTASVSGAMMTGSDFYTPFLFTTATYFIASSLYYIFFRKAESSVDNAKPLN